MFNRKKNPLVNKREAQQFLGLDRIEEQIKQLQIKIKQLECMHNFKVFKWWEPGVIIPNPGRIGRVVFKCTDCGKQKTRYWKYLPKKEQQALKTLNLVPEDWEVNTKGSQR